MLILCHCISLCKLSWDCEEGGQTRIFLTRMMFSSHLRESILSLLSVNFPRRIPWKKQEHVYFWAEKVTGVGVGVETCRLKQHGGDNNIIKRKHLKLASQNHTGINFIILYVMVLSLFRSFTVTLPGHFGTTTLEAFSIFLLEVQVNSTRSCVVLRNAKRTAELLPWPLILWTVTPGGLTCQDKSTSISVEEQCSSIQQLLFIGV